MAKKEPETIDHFKVSCKVAKEKLGDVLAMFTRMGLEHVEYEMITDVLNFKQRQTYDVDGVTALREWIKDHPTFKRSEAVAHFAPLGRSQHSVSNAVHRLAKLKELISLGNGNYQRADIKAIAGPKAKVKNSEPRFGKKTGKPLRDTSKRYDIPNRDFILRLLGKRKSMTLAQMIEAFEKDDRAPQSVSPVLDKLMSLHKVRRIAQGEYAIVRRPKPHTIAPKKLNGAATPEVHAEAPANG